MSVLIISDFHLGHRTILKHTKKTQEAYPDSDIYRGGTNTEEHDEWVIQQCLSVGPTKRTLWWLLGDIAMEIDRLALLDRLPGRKFLILGNHDKFKTQTYLKFVDQIYGGIKKYNLWLTHFPLHPAELRGLGNIHGHCHKEQINDPRYLNVSMEWIPNHKPISLDEVRTHHEALFA